jgi:beta-phosphoglucomutase-like phosphatase (HAD superfamily)
LWTRLVEIAMSWAGPGNFDVLVCGDEVDNTKPHPEPYLLAAKLLGVDIGGCVAIEDSPTGVASAAAAGARVLAIPHHVPLQEGPRITMRDTLAGITLADLAALSE